MFLVRFFACCCPLAAWWAQFWKKAPERRDACFAGCANFSLSSSSLSASSALTRAARIVSVVIWTAVFTFWTGLTITLTGAEDKVSAITYICVAVIWTLLVFIVIFMFCLRWNQALQNVYYNKELFPDYDPPKSRSPTPRPEEEHELMEFERGSRDSEESQRTSL